jgi:hypothetical protein
MIGVNGVHDRGGPKSRNTFSDRQNAHTDFGRGPEPYSIITFPPDGIWRRCKNSEKSFYYSLLKKKRFNTIREPNRLKKNERKKDYKATFYLPIILQNGEVGTIQLHPPHNFHSSRFLISAANNPKNNFISDFFDAACNDEVFRFLLRECYQYFISSQLFITLQFRVIVNFIIVKLFTNGLTFSILFCVSKKILDDIANSNRWTVR